MKKSTLLTVFLFSFILVFSQKDSITLQSITVYSGRAVLSEGILIETSFQRGEDIIVLTLGERDLYAFYWKSFFKGKFLVGPCLEYFQNVPVLGATAFTNPFKNITTFTWSGVSAGTPGEKIELSNWKFLFFYQNIEWKINRFTLSGAIMYYEKEWVPIAEVRYSQPINNKIELFTGIGYKFATEGTPLLRLGGVYKF